jgi:hypothetical protein
MASFTGNASSLSAATNFLSFRAERSNLHPVYAPRWGLPRCFAPDTKLGDFGVTFTVMAGTSRVATV